MHDVAVVKVNFVKKGRNERGAAKAHIRYIAYRRGKDGARISRTLFGAGGQIDRHQAYKMIDQAEEGSTYFRIVISPDVKTEDTKQDLLLREITEKTMAIEEKIGKQVQWAAAIHADHTNIRHVHVLAVARERLLPVQTMRQQATEAALEQRRELDRAREQQQERAGKEAEWERER